MKTRYNSLINLKKNIMDKSELVFQRANFDLNSATVALKLSYKTLEEIKSPQSGTMSDTLASRTLMASERGIIKHNQGWVVFAKDQVLQAKEQLKKDMIEHEKFKYLELEEVKKIIKKKKIQEMKDLDEVALMTHQRKGKK